MENEFIVKNFETQDYFHGVIYGKYSWGKEPYLAHYFKWEEDAVSFIKTQDGRFQIEKIFSH